MLVAQVLCEQPESLTCAYAVHKHCYAHDMPRQKLCVAISRAGVRHVRGAQALGQLNTCTLHCCVCFAPQKIFRPSSSYAVHLQAMGPGMHRCLQPLRRADVVRDLRVVVQEVHRAIVERVVRRHRLCGGGRRELRLPVAGHLEALRRDHAWQRGRQGVSSAALGKTQRAFSRASACSAGAEARTALAARVGDAVRRAEAGNCRAGQRAGAVRRVAECVVGARLRPAQAHAGHALPTGLRRADCCMRACTCPAC